ncbi:MAG: DUF2017 domain-containing protein [Acidimicrobiia bacterium]|nr:DUF2017 domain-containing protein [Acidimicrobiia bacterium]MDH5520701.1 DUF2017 domain-containing protein [Acidimicrobiia bacterium]
MVRFRRPKPFEALDDGRFRVKLAPDVRSFLVRLADEIDEIVALDIPETRRLFPTAYPHDPEKDAGYQVLSRDGLIEQRRTAADTVRETADNEVVTEDELAQWMSVINDARLVLGTRLDVSEDDEPDFDDPDIGLYLIYDELGYLLDSIVTAMITVLPDPDDGEDS